MDYSTHIYCITIILSCAIITTLQCILPWTIQPPPPTLFISKCSVLDSKSRLKASTRSLCDSLACFATLSASLCFRILSNRRSASVIVGPEDIASGSSSSSSFLKESLGILASSPRSELSA
jgi:hypothetical protein